MLFLLTGEVQTGKTRWLEGALAALEQEGVSAYGVIAPGRWRVNPDPAAPRPYEKLGIDNRLLPGGQVIPFATRRDLLEAGKYDAACTQAKSLQLGWAISDEAVAQVNAHFDGLGRGALAGRGLLVVDELGRLEVEREAGLTSALALLAAGPTDAWQHALVVVRDYLLDRAEARYADAWGGAARLSPGPAAAQTLLSAFA